MINKSANKEILRKPPWLKVKSILSPVVSTTQQKLQTYGIKTVCLEASCPNRCECWKNKSFTFILLGNKCTRACPFCNIVAQKPDPVDPDEPKKIAQFTADNHLNHMVLTSVTRDDLSDGGASQFIQTIRAIRKVAPDIPVELLVPDFGDFAYFDQLLQEHFEIFGYNVETVARLYPQVRPQYMYERCLELLSYIKTAKPSLPVKSSLIIGLGETDAEIRQTLIDLKNAGCDIAYIGQYLAPSKKHWPVRKYYTPEEFEQFELFGKTLGFTHILAGPLVRSSYQSWKTLH